MFSKCAKFAQETFALVKMSLNLSYSVILMSDNLDTTSIVVAIYNSILVASQRNISQPDKAKKSAKQLRSDIINARASVCCYSFRGTKAVVEEQDNNML